jgi:HrpA-like RNA helicase
MSDQETERINMYLPVAAVVADLRAALARHKAAVLVAPPGAGTRGRLSQSHCLCMAPN